MIGEKLVKEDGLEYLLPEPRPNDLTNITVEAKTGCDDMFVTVTFTKDGRPFEVFIHHGKNGQCHNVQNDVLSRVISIAMRCGVDWERVLKAMTDGECDKPVWYGRRRIKSCSDSMAIAIRKAVGIHQGWDYAER